MSDGFEELDGLLVEVDEVMYMPNLDAPPDRPHPFVYFIPGIAMFQSAGKIITDLLKMFQHMELSFRRKYKFPGKDMLGAKVFHLLRLTIDNSFQQKFPAAKQISQPFG